MMDNPLDYPSSVAVATSGNVYVVGAESHNAFEITPGGAITQIIDETGDVVGNSLDTPNEVVVGPLDNVYISGHVSENIFQVTALGAISEITGRVDDDDDVVINAPTELAIAASGLLYVTDRGGNVHVVDPGVSVEKLRDGDAIKRTIDRIADLAVDAADNLYMAGADTNNAIEIAAP